MKQLAILIAVLSCLPGAALASSVSCGLNDLGSFPAVFFGEAPSDLDLSSFQEFGMVGIDVTISGNGKTVNLTASQPYTKVGNRIEFNGAFRLMQMKSEPFKAEFGAFPEVTCNIP